LITNYLIFSSDVDSSNPKKRVATNFSNFKAMKNSKKQEKFVTLQQTKKEKQ